MSRPKISVIMSVYNGMPFLKKSVKSILTQSFSDFEFIIIDDASKDKTWNYLKSLADERIKLIKNSKNLGLAASLNKGLKIAKGIFIARMDADDISTPHRLMVQYEFLERNPQIDVCGSFVKVIDEREKIMGEIRKPITDDLIKKEIYWVPPLLHPTWFGRKKVFSALKGYDPKWEYVEDFEFLTRAERYKMANIPDYLLNLRTQSQRRSEKTVYKIYVNTLKLRLKVYKEKHLGIGYLPILLRSYISTYLFPSKLKIFLNKLRPT